MRYSLPLALTLSILACGCSPRGPLLVAPGLPPPLPLPMEPTLRVEAERIVDPGGTPVMLRGVAFSNQVWDNVPVPAEHHNELDYRRVAELGMNTVRFYLNYRTFEEDSAPGQYKPEGWAWLDQNIVWARQHGIYLVLNLHVPPGGYQSQGKGTGLWEDATAQQRFIDLWRAIAEHCRGEPTIAGYDLLNEAVVTKRAEQWHELAEQTIAALREVDAEHIVFVERVNAVAGDWKEDEQRNFFRVQDPNAVYEFHFYEPFHFTHQGAPWVQFAAEDQRYPDETKIGARWFLLEWRTGTHDSPKLPVGDSNWEYYAGAPFQVDDPELVVGKPALVCDANSGKGYFDDIVLEQLDTDGNVARELWRANLNTTRGWYFWTKDGSGTSHCEPEGHDDDASLSISATGSLANLSADIYRFRTEPGATYRLSGWMRGEQIPDGSTCQIRLDFFSSKVPVHARNRAFLAQELDAYAAWGEREHVPLFLGEFGVIRAGFEQDRGGIRWVQDMLDLLLERDLHFTYHAYHEEHFALYYGDGALPTPADANTALIELFRRKLGQ
jgi:endoglucanase